MASASCSNTSDPEIIESPSTPRTEIEEEATASTSTVSSPSESEVKVKEVDLEKLKDDPVDSEVKIVDLEKLKADPVLLQTRLNFLKSQLMVIAVKERKLRREKGAKEGTKSTATIKPPPPPATPAPESAGSEVKPKGKKDDEAKLCELVKSALAMDPSDPAAGPAVPTTLPFKKAINDELGYKLRQEAKKIIWKRKSAELLDQNDLMYFYTVLEKHAKTHIKSPENEIKFQDFMQQKYGIEPENKLIFFSDYMKAKEELDDRFKPFLTATLYYSLLSGVNDPYRRVPILMIFNYVMKKTWLKQTRLGLMNYDNYGSGSMTEEGMESYLKELLPTIPKLDSLDPTFQPFYLCAASRKFFFFLDPQRLGRIKIIDILASGLIDDILDLREKEYPETNWFSEESAMKVYSHYLALDRDQNGMLSREEFLSYNFSYTNGCCRLTRALVDQLFSKCMTYEGEIDFRTYVDFVMAMENRKEQQAQAYFFRLLDLNNKGHLDASDLNYFYKDVEKMLKKYPEFPKFGDVKDEIFDMVKPADPMRIRLKDLLNSGKAETVISMLIDAKGFDDYENREGAVLQVIVEPSEVKISEV